MPRTMTVTPGNLSLNGTSFLGENHGMVDKPSEQSTWNVLLFCLTFTIAFPALLGSVFSLVSLLKMQNKTTVSLIVTSLAIDDLISIVPLIIFMLTQWSSEVLSQPLCTTSALMYLFQGISSNLKGSLIVSYNFYTTTMAETLRCSASKRRVSVVWAILTIWIVSLLICILPLCRWGRYIPTPWGCFPDRASSFVLLPFVVYSLCLSLLAVLAAPLTHQLLCSPQPLHTHCLEGSGGRTTPGTPPLSPPEPADNTLHRCPTSEAVFGKGVAGSGALMGSTQGRSFRVGFAQKRFSLILALTKVVLWLPMMVQMVVQYITGVQSLSFETLSFLLTALAATVTPVFVLSQHWLHLPCGCIINCRGNSWAVASEELRNKRRGFEFNLSFQQGYGIYRISQENHPHPSKSASYHSLVGSDCGDPEPGRGRGDARGPDPPEPSSEGPGACRGEQGTSCDPSATPEGPEWRLSHEESHQPELSDWEWCRSKSERNPRQHPGGTLAIPLCAFQGTVSLQAPTGKTLSLSTYEVSSEGHKITPLAKKIEVYRSKSVGHEPSPEESPHTLADTSVKIHLEVLEICDNEEALDTVSIVSNISQSSTQARSPSLRFSRRENRFVSCELGESASYSLLIPSHGSDISISIPDTVEAHRQNSHRQRLDSGHREDIQLLNQAYLLREGQSCST